MLKTKKTHRDKNETIVEFSDKILVPRPEVEEFIEALEKLISEFAV